MLIESKWAVCDIKGGVYYTGDNDSGAPVMECLNSSVRLYKNERGANSAIRHIKESGGVEPRELKAVYIESKNVPDVTRISAGQFTVTDPPIIKNDGTWTIIDQFGKIKYVKKITTAKPIFAVLDENGDLRGFGFDELGAWLWYSEHRRNIGARLIRERGK